MGSYKCPSTQHDRSDVRFYRVRPGDTFYLIARDLGTTVEELIRLNPGVDPNNLRVGQTIRVPVISNPLARWDEWDWWDDDWDDDWDWWDNDWDNNPGNPDRRRRRPRRCPRGSREYTVRRGDTFLSIARRFGTTVAEIRRLNPGVRSEDLFPGQVICVPERRPRPRPCPRGSREYTVRRGDTFLSIARRFGTTVAEIRRLNPDVRPEDLVPGQVICVPERRPRPRPCPRGSREYTVRRGDTFLSIARRFGTTVAEIRRLNPDVRPEDLVPGQVICVPER
ncbi:lytic transglycosylase [Halonatronum saccharophilum]|uniref:lytic transglycosylase n=1 Tax=Halonatronum saccharophilum TaxID=150060 RepID=UPI0004B223EA|nr:LysM domain-containing protein [Halonatronum saccharophilum]